MKKSKKDKAQHNSEHKKEDGIYVDGTVTEARANAMFDVKLDNDYTVLCTISGKIRQHFIRILPDDRVQVKLSPYDLSRGIIVYNYK